MRTIEKHQAVKRDSIDCTEAGQKATTQSGESKNSGETT